MNIFWLRLSALALAVAYLVPNHYLPWLSFHMEAAAAWAVLPVAAFILVRCKCIPSNELIWLCAACLVVALVQRLVGIVHFNGTTATTALYLLGLMIAAITGSAWQVGHPQQPERYLGTAFVVAAIVSLPIATLQWIGWGWETAYLLGATSTRAVANMAQPNLLADLFLLGVCGLQLAWVACRQNRWLSKACFFGGVLLLFGVAITGSRTGAINVLLLSAVAWWIAPQHPSQVPGRAWIASLCAMYLVALLVAPEIQTRLQEMSDENLVFSAGSANSRLTTWTMMSKALLETPWAGFGWQQILKINFVFKDSMGMEPGMFGQSHNIFLDLMLWMGIPLGVIASVAYARIVWRSIKQGAKDERWAVCAMVAVLTVHAQLEYPLQYAYFLLPYGLLLGSLQAPRKSFFTPAIHRIPVVLLLLVTTGLFVLVNRDYLRVEKAFYALRYEAKGYLTSYPKDEPRVLVLDQLAAHIQVSRADPALPISDEEMARRELVTRVTPGPYIVLQLAETYAYHGNRERAVYWLDQLCTKFVADACNAGKQWWSRPSATGLDAPLGAWPLQPSGLNDPHASE